MVPSARRAAGRPASSSSSPAASDEVVVRAPASASPPRSTQQRHRVQRLVPVLRVAQQVARAGPTRGQPGRQRGRLLRGSAGPSTAPAGGVPHSAGEPVDQLGRPLVALRRHLAQEPPQQRRATAARTPRGRSPRWAPAARRAPSPRTAARWPARFCRAATNSDGLLRRAAATSDRFVVSLSVPATKPTARSQVGLRQHHGIGPVADEQVRVRRPSLGCGSMTVTSRPSARRSAVSSRPSRP